MESFAEYIKNYLKQRNISYSSAAKLCGIDRTILGRYAKGSRMPQNTDAVQKIAEGLQMSVEEQDAILQAYKRTKISEEYHTDYRILSAVVNKEHLLLPQKEAAGEIISGEATGYSLHSADEILAAVSAMKKKASFIKIKYNPDHKQELSVLLAAPDEDCHIEHIISISNSKWQYMEERMRNLEILLPFLFQENQYQLYYHYQREQNNIKAASDMNFILSDSGMVLFDDALERGFFSDQAVPLSYYSNWFDSMKANSRIFAEGGRKQYTLWKNKKSVRRFENKETGVGFFVCEEEPYIWMMQDRKERGICIREAGVVQFLWKFLWCS